MVASVILKQIHRKVRTYVENHPDSTDLLSLLQYDTSIILLLSDVRNYVRDLGHSVGLFK